MPMPTPIPLPENFPVTWDDPMESMLLWEQEQLHLPHAVTPLGGELAMMALGPNITAGLHDLGAPVEWVKFKVINGYIYSGAMPNFALIEGAEERVVFEEHAEPAHVLPIDVRRDECSDPVEDRVAVVSRERSQEFGHARVSMHRGKRLAIGVPERAQHQTRSRDHDASVARCHLRISRVSIESDDTANPSRVRRSVGIRAGARARSAAWPSSRSGPVRTRWCR